MITKSSCQHCGQHIEFEAENAGEFVPCPSCGKQTRLLLPASKPTAKGNYPIHQPSVMGNLKSLLPKPAADTNAKKHLNFVRENSCYPQLRFIINICFLLALVGGGIYAAIIALALIRNENYFPLIYFCLGVALAAVLLIAIRQSSLLLIDVADTLLHEHAKTKD